MLDRIRRNLFDRKRGVFSGPLLARWLQKEGVRQLVGCEKKKKARKRP
jgi:hypothetical protein